MARLRCVRTDSLWFRHIRAREAQDNETKRISRKCISIVGKKKTKRADRNLAPGTRSAATVSGVSTPGASGGAQLLKLRRARVKYFGLLMQGKDADLFALANG